MSSAILYVAIVVIWACVLIPRWLRRDAPAYAADSAGQAGDGAPVAAAAGNEPVPEPAPVARRRGSAADERRPVPDEDHGAPAVGGPAHPAHRRVLSARRRLLLMLVALGITSGVLAGAKMAAWWVIVPPSVMLLGYLLLLRAAAKADAEHRERARYRAARAAAQAARAPARRPAPVAAGAPVTSVAAATPAAAAAAGAKIISIPTAAPEPPEEEIYDQYADAKLRAVGD